MNCSFRVVMVGIRFKRMINVGRLGLELAFRLGFGWFGLKLELGLGFLTGERPSGTPPPPPPLG